LGDFVCLQDPVMFSGTVRFNLDPFNLHADHVLVEALQSCDLQVRAHVVNPNLNSGRKRRSVSVAHRPLCLQGDRCAS